MSIIAALGRHFVWCIGRDLGNLAHDKIGKCSIVFLDLKNILFDTKYVILANIGVEICPYGCLDAILEFYHVTNLIIVSLYSSTSET